MGSENNFNGKYFHHHFISKLVSVEMACVLGIQNEIQYGHHHEIMGKIYTSPQLLQKFTTKVKLM